MYLWWLVDVWALSVQNNIQYINNNITDNPHRLNGWLWYEFLSRYFITASIPICPPWLPTSRLRCPEARQTYFLCFNYIWTIHQDTLISPHPNCFSFFSRVQAKGATAREGKADFLNASFHFKNLIPVGAGWTTVWGYSPGEALIFFLLMPHRLKPGPINSEKRAHILGWATASDSDLMNKHVGSIFEGQILTSARAHSLLASKKKSSSYIIYIHNLLLYLSVVLIRAQRT